MNPKIKVAQIGLGPIGIECLKLLAAQNWVQIVGAVDIDPVKAQRHLDMLRYKSGAQPLRAVASINELREPPYLVFHTAVSSFRTAYDQLVPIVSRGIDVVSSCEELIFPALREPELAARLDRICRKSGARVVAAGVNPGFVMDLLPLFLSSVTQGIKSIRVERVVNASTRREPLQHKIGSGMPPAAFTKLLRAGRAGHAGLAESAALIAHCLTGSTGQIQETGKAMVARSKIRTRYVTVLKGQTCGLHQRAETKVAGKLHVVLDLKMYLDARDPHDHVRIDGVPSLNLSITDGVAGDPATVAALVNSARRLLRCTPGLKLISQLSVV